ncbi:hypothetical protein HKD37_06G017392 [Glycine soja]
MSGASHLTFTKTNTKRKGWECGKNKVENQRHQTARKEKKSLRGRKTRGIRQQEKKNQRRNRKQSLPARGRKPMRQWRRLREEEGEDTERQEMLLMGRDARVYVVGRVQPEVSSCSTASGDGGSDGHRVAPESYAHGCPVRVRRETRRENVPPACNTNKVKRKNHNNPKPKKRVPLADITNRFNNSATTTFTLAHQQQSGVSVLSGRTLRMGFR